MNTLIITALILAFLGIAYQTGSSRSRALAGTSGRRLHSRPSYHGSAIAIWTLVPLLLVLGAWALLDSYVIRTFITWYLPESLVAEGGNALRASIARVEALATGYGVVGEVQDERVVVVERHRARRRASGADAARRRRIVAV